MDGWMDKIYFFIHPKSMDGWIYFQPSKRSMVFFSYFYGWNQKSFFFFFGWMDPSNHPSIFGWIKKSIFSQMDGWMDPTKYFFHIFLKKSMDGWMDKKISFQKSMDGWMDKKIHLFFQMDGWMDPKIHIFFIHPTIHGWLDWTYMDGWIYPKPPYGWMDRKKYMKKDGFGSIQKSIYFGWLDG